jgi:hypothetical protein
VLEASPDGARYIETVNVGGTRIINQGSCEFRNLDDLHLENKQAAMPERVKL